MNTGNVYCESAEMGIDGAFPSILPIGDSWFWYPLPGGSLINQLGQLVAPKKTSSVTGS